MLMAGSNKRHYQLQRVHVYDKGGRNSLSGINATVFGATGNLGMALGSTLSRVGS